MSYSMPLTPIFWCQLNKQTTDIASLGSGVYWNPILPQLQKGTFDTALRYNTLYSAVVCKDSTGATCQVWTGSKVKGSTHELKQKRDKISSYSLLFLFLFIFQILNFIQMLYTMSRQVSLHPTKNERELKDLIGKIFPGKSSPPHHLLKW